VQAGAVGEIADGVIVGTRLVRAIADAPTLEAGLGEVQRFLGETAAALPQV
jgi:tryptophan synthase alpha subunit